MTSPALGTDASIHATYDRICGLVARTRELSLHDLASALLLAVELDRAEPSSALVAELCGRLGVEPVEVEVA